MQQSDIANEDQRTITMPRNRHRNELEECHKELNDLL